MIVIVIVLVIRKYHMIIASGITATGQQPKTYPHPRIPAARLFVVILCFSVFSPTWENPEVGGGDNFGGS